MKAKTVLRGLLLLVLAAGIVLAIIYRDHLDAAALEDWINNAGVLAPLIFMLVYALATVFFLPGSVVTLAGGALFGPVLGTFYNLTGATLGALLAFLISRYLASDWVEQKTGGRLRQLIKGVEAEGWRFVAFVRLMPLFPFNLLNYALGLTRISALQYVIASYLFMLPGALAYTYIGYVGREAIGGDEGLIQKILIALALLAIVAFLPRIIAGMRRGPMMEVAELRQRLEAQSILVLDVRDAAEFSGEQGHIATALNIAVDELPARIGELQEYQESSIALVCKTDRRSEKAARLLAAQGFADVHVVHGGITAWLKSGFQLVTGERG